jgi:aryl-alcohol dehydrogenase-like predicted oxidoreductase
MIEKLVFGPTDHHSTQVIFGGYALSEATQAEADETLEILLEYGINHIDTASIYGKAEERIGPWMEKHRDKFFLATKSGHRTYDGAWRDLQHSLKLLRVETIDLWQMHSLTNPEGWEKAMGPGGALEAFLKAREEGLARFLGVTGHGSKVPAVHQKSLARYDFDSVLLPYSYRQMQDERYAMNFNALLEICRERNVAIQTIKSVARRPWGDHPKTHNTYFYQPLEDQTAIDKAVHWVMGLEDSFIITPGDMRILPRVLDAATRFEQRPTDTEMNALMKELGIQLVFSY